ncbi:HD domain-containing protein [Roseovarius aestuarii]|nr:HD domain-containing protein [Roseovarius aestuarii]
MLTDRFDDALSYTARLHRSQSRKVSGIPYIAHLMSVSALVLEYGGDEDQAIAGLLHDAVEDQGGPEAASEIARRYGDRVAGIVCECSDSDGVEKAGWDVRKRAYITGIATKSDDAILVTACDKLHNASSILDDLRTVGPVVFDRFTAKQDKTLWYYRALSEALNIRLTGNSATQQSIALSKRLAATVADIEEVARA